MTGKKKTLFYISFYWIWQRLAKQLNVFFLQGDESRQFFFLSLSNILVFCLLKLCHFYQIVTHFCTGFQAGLCVSVQPS